MTERLSKLLCVKSIVTICLTVLFFVLCIQGKISGEQFLTVFTTVIAFYFGTQSTRNVKVDDALPLEIVTAEQAPNEVNKETPVTE